MDISLVDYCYVHGQALAADKTLKDWEKNSGLPYTYSTRNSLEKNQPHIPSRVSLPTYLYCINKILRENGYKYSQNGQPCNWAPKGQYAFIWFRVCFISLTLLQTKKFRVRIELGIFQLQRTSRSEKDNNFQNPRQEPHTCSSVDIMEYILHLGHKLSRRPHQRMSPCDNILNCQFLISKNA